MIFPKSTLYFVEGFEGEMTLKFLAEDTGLKNAVTLKQVLIAMGGVDMPDLLKEYSPYASLDKVKNGIRNLCKIILTHFRSSIFAEFGWIYEYEAYMARDSA
jgi:hypothetical protein